MPAVRFATEFGHLHAQQTCLATPSSVAPASWASPSGARDGSKAAHSERSSSLDIVADVPLTGAAKRFDYQSLDSATGRLYISHMRGDPLDVFATRNTLPVAILNGFTAATGVWAVPDLPKSHVSVT